VSFILDALRKSEHDRQRGSGPGIAEVAVARRAERTNPWAAVAIGLLLLNLLAAGGWLLSKALREPPTASTRATTAAERAAQQAPTITADPTASAGPEPGAPPPMMAPAAETSRVSGAPTAAAANPLAEELAADPRLVDEYVDPEIVAAASAPPALAPPAAPPSPGSTSVRTAGGRVVYETEPLDSPPIGSPPPTSAERTASLPTADDVASQAGLPDLHLDIHVYSTVASERFVFVNGAKYREGESLQAGPTVESITPEGVVLSFRGSRFMLPRP
jgi:general secretion pathway protein B